MAVRNSKFLDKQNWSLIKRGWIFEAAMPYIPKRPLDFFIPDDDCNYRGTCVSVNEAFLTGKVHQVVLSIKPRKVVVISADVLNEDTEHFDVTVAKIYSIYEEDKTEPWYQPTVEGTHPLFAYLPKNVTGRECYIDLATATNIHKNMLLEEKMDISSYLPVIDNRLNYCFELGIYSKNKEQSEEDAS